MKCLALREENEKLKETNITSEVRKISRFQCACHKYKLALNKVS